MIWTHQRHEFQREAVLFNRGGQCKLKLSSAVTRFVKAAVKHTIPNLLLITPQKTDSLLFVEQACPRLAFVLFLQAFLLGGMDDCSDDVDILSIVVDMLEESFVTEVSRIKGASVEDD